MAISKQVTKPFYAAVILLALFVSLVSARPGKGCRGFHTAFSFSNFGDDVEKLTFLGDAKVLESGLQIVGSKASSAGGVFYSEPVRFTSPFHKGLSKSFSTFFSFSMDASKGDGLAFVIAPSKIFHGRNGPWLGLSDKPSDLTHTIAVEFDSYMDAEVHDPSGNHVGFDLESLVSLATAEVSDGFSLKEGERLFAWIDYIAPAKVLEVRLSRSEEERPEKPVLSHNVELGNVWQEEMFVGFTSSTGNSPQRHIIYSWSFMTRGMGPRFHPGFFGPHEGHGDWHHGPRDWHHGPQDWHHGHAGRDHEGFPYWPGHDVPHEWHPDHFRPHPADNDDSWFDGLNDVWGVVFSLLFGVFCGLVFCGLVRLCFRCWLSRCKTEKGAGFVFGYQKVDVTESKDVDAKTNANGYQKLPTTDSDANTESV
ncbi:hypothetical protein L7F22_027059 [Adiantum nelumboides]|nr:hypothetical protein [Adiantum nelumboides]